MSLSRQAAEPRLAALCKRYDVPHGSVDARPGERISELEFARALAVVADKDPDLIRFGGDLASTPSISGSERVSYLPPLETTLERFVRESRSARAAGEFAVERRQDETRLEAAE